MCYTAYGGSQMMQKKGKVTCKVWSASTVIAKESLSQLTASQGLSSSPHSDVDPELSIFSTPDHHPDTPLTWASHNIRSAKIPLPWLHFDMRGSILKFCSLGILSAFFPADQTWWPGTMNMCLHSSGRNSEIIWKVLQRKTLKKVCTHPAVSGSLCAMSRLSTHPNPHLLQEASNAPTLIHNHTYRLNQCPLHCLVFKDRRRHRASKVWVVTTLS